MAIDTVTPRSRRALLAATAGSLAALAAQALGRPLPARAADPNDVVLGATNYSGSTTRIHNNITSSTAFWASSSSSGTGVKGSSASGTGVEASVSSGFGVYSVAGSGVGVVGLSSSGIAVWGSSSSGVAVFGDGGSHHGVAGENSGSARAAVVGDAKGGSTGVQGFSHETVASLPSPPALTGVYGYAAEGSGSRGVTGQSTAGRGVNGLATSGRGVHGYASSGIGVYAAAGATGTALRAQGAVRFSSAGLATVNAGNVSVTVPAGVDLTAESKVLCTLQGNAGGATTVKRVSINAATDEFTIFLTGNSTATVKVAWFVIG